VRRFAPLAIEPALRLLVPFRLTQRGRVEVLQQGVQLLGPLVRHPQALGLNVAIYDPALDPDRSCARRLVAFLANLIAPPDVRSVRLQADQ